ncbi:MAG: (2Fe-2S)-binding protein, partial [Acidobacteria bacterium]|nr:(2Fe-2S)-binding protein [Acidobacteriota bacterium]
INLKKIRLKINDQQIEILQGSTVATAIFASDAELFRRSISGEPRFPLCGIGICFECRATVDGVKHKRTCQLIARDGMSIETDE